MVTILLSNPIVVPLPFWVRVRAGGYSLAVVSLLLCDVGIFRQSVGGQDKVYRNSAKGVICTGDYRTSSILFYCVSKALYLDSSIGSLSYFLRLFY